MARPFLSRRIASSGKLMTTKTSNSSNDDLNRSSRSLESRRNEQQQGSNNGIPTSRSLESRPAAAGRDSSEGLLGAKRRIVNMAHLAGEQQHPSEKKEEAVLGARPLYSKDSSFRVKDLKTTNMPARRNNDSLTTDELVISKVQEALLVKKQQKQRSERSLFGKPRLVKDLSTRSLGAHKSTTTPVEPGVTYYKGSLQLNVSTQEATDSEEDSMNKSSVEHTLDDLEYVLTKERSNDSQILLDSLAEMEDQLKRTKRPVFERSQSSPQRELKQHVLKVDQNKHMDDWTLPSFSGDSTIGGSFASAESEMPDVWRAEIIDMAYCGSNSTKKKDSPNASPVTDDESELKESAQDARASVEVKSSGSILCSNPAEKCKTESPVLDALPVCSEEESTDSLFDELMDSSSSSAGNSLPSDESSIDTALEDEEVMRYTNSIMDSGRSYCSAGCSEGDELNTTGSLFDKTFDEESSSEDSASSFVEDESMFDDSTNFDSIFDSVNNMSTDGTSQLVHSDSVVDRMLGAFDRGMMTLAFQNKKSTNPSMDDPVDEASDEDADSEESGSDEETDFDIKTSEFTSKGEDGFVYPKDKECRDDGNEANHSGKDGEDCPSDNKEDNNDRRMATDAVSDIAFMDLALEVSYENNISTSPDSDTSHASKDATHSFPAVFNEDETSAANSEEENPLWGEGPTLSIEQLESYEKKSKVKRKGDFLWLKEPRSKTRGSTEWKHGQGLVENPRLFQNPRKINAGELQDSLQRRIATAEWMQNPASPTNSVHQKTSPKKSSVSFFADDAKSPRSVSREFLQDFDVFGQEVAVDTAADPSLSWEDFGSSPFTMAKREPEPRSYRRDIADVPSDELSSEGVEVEHGFF